MCYIRFRMRRHFNQPVIKTGIASNLFLEMDNFTLQRHIRLNMHQFNRFVNFLTVMHHDDVSGFGGIASIPVERKALIFLWYMANSNSLREISDKFNVAQGGAHRFISRLLRDIHHFSHRYIRWPDNHSKEQNARQFLCTSGLPNIIGAIDGCHIRISRPSKHGNSYLNRKGYYSILLQGVCDWRGKFTHVFIGPPWPCT